MLVVMTIPSEQESLRGSVFSEVVNREARVKAPPPPNILSFLFFFFFLFLSLVTRL